MKHLIFLFLAATLAGSYPVLADEKKSTSKQDAEQIPRGKVTQFGLFGQLNRGLVRDKQNTSTGKVILRPKVEFTESTARIPLRKGVYFGYRYWLKLPPRTRPELKRVLIHPEMTLPDGSKVTRSERMIRKRATHGIVTSLDLYALSEDYELVEGDWIFQLWYENKMLVEQKFTSYWPEEEKAEKPEQASNI